MQVNFIKTEIYWNNKVGVPESTGVIIIEFQGQHMIATGQPVFSINGINYYWFQPTHLQNIIQIPQEDELTNLRREVKCLQTELGSLREVQDSLDKT